MSGSKSLFAAILILMAFSQAVSAHHSQAVFDAGAEITLEGIVTRYEWANPHIYIYVATDPASDDGAVWAIEANPPSAMRRRGWSSDSFAIGESIVVVANPARNTSKKLARGIRAEKADGAVLTFSDLDALDGRGGSTQAIQTDSLSGTWAPLTEPADATRLILGGDRSAWPLTERGAQAAAQYVEQTMHPEVRCINRTAPWIMLFPGVQQIEIDDAVGFIRTEYGPVERVIHMDATSHDGADASLQGHSIGWWEDDVLVVDTMHFADHRIGIAWQVPSGDRKHLVERLSLDPDGATLTYQFELEDPEYLTRTLTGEAQWAYRPDLDFAPVECDLENAQQFLEN